MFFAKLKILLWKNWVLQKRRPISTVVQLILPIFIVVVAAWMKSSFEKMINWGLFEFEDEFNITNFTMCNRTLERLFYTPIAEPYDLLMEESFKQFEFEIRGFESEEAMNDEFFKSFEIYTIAIAFTANLTEIPTVMPSTVYLNVNPFNWGGNRNCELMVQNELERGFIGIYSKSTQLNSQTTMRAFPYDDEFQQIFTIIMISVLPLMLVFSMFSIVANVVKGIASERQSGMKELMKIMGLSSAIHWLSWFIKSIIMTTIIYTIVTVFVCIPIFGETAIFGLSNFFVIWLFLFIYCIGVITFSFMVSTFFRKASSAANIGVMLFFTTFVPFYVYGTNFEEMHYFVKWFFLLPINTAFGQGVTMALNMELNKRGITFDNLFSHYEGFNFSLGEVMAVMLLSSIIHILLTIYFESVFPGDAGVPKKWHFPITSFIKLIKRRDKEPAYFVNNDNAKYRTSDSFEEEPKHMNAKVRIVDLTKKFGSFTAVNNLSLNIYEDQITVLLGHNGGGKTTTMNVLTGMLPPTQGTAFVNGFDIRTETEDARKSLGICPQHNVLFNDLTVEEHIIFFCRLKGMRNMDEIKMEIEKYLKLMNFEDKRNKKSKTLSGGQKRKLSIANALCANSQFVVLDEPTSGLDVSARRNLWDLLISEKKGRTVLLTTHYMDEAEVLGDRIAIMSEGVLKTVGTSFFLKKKFGSGYRLIVVKAPNCDSMKILETIKAYAPDVSIESEEQMEVIFVVSDEFIGKFDSIFKQLETDSQDLGISSLGCSLATLEEVFLRIGEDMNLKTTHDTTINLNSSMSFDKVSYIQMMFNQMYALILKKIHFTRRNYVPLIVFTILSAWFLFVFLAAPLGPADAFDFNVQLVGIVQHKDLSAAIVQNYKSLFDGRPVEAVTRDIDEFIFGNFLNRNLRFQVGATFGGDIDTVWYNYQQHISLKPLALNFYHRTLLRNSNAEHDIRVHHHLLNERLEEVASEERNQFDDMMVYVLFFLLLMYWSSLHVTLKIRERVTKMKLLQFISGANRFLFTFTSFVLDSLITIAILFIAVGIVFATGREGFNTFTDISVHLVVITFYVMNVVPLIYIMSFWFEKHTTGETVTSIIPLAFAILYIVYAILDQTFQSTVSDILTSIVYWFGMFFAPFSLINVYVKLQAILYFDEGEIWSFGERGLGINLVMMSAGSLIYLLLVMLKDYRALEWIKYKSQKGTKSLPPISSSDEDVTREIERVLTQSSTDIIQNNLVLKGLSKRYGNLVAVNQLYVGVESAECFGLLGVNGAGKTSVFKMLTGDEMITSGDSWISGFSLTNEISKVYNEIGYCPQYDALLDELTGRETMKIFCLLRGIPLHQIRDITEFFANELDFTRYLDVQVGQYSGGNKRKLSTSLSLLGNLSLVFLDECSSGIDARAKRQLWNAIKQARGDGKSIVISSHSMQECESLCTRLAIMVDGEFQCIGSIQHIKNKFAKGFILKIMMSQRDDEELFQKINNHILKTFPMAKLKERFMGLLTFHIDLPELKWSQVFAELSKMKTELGINDYTLTQSSLESVFLFFSQQGKTGKTKIE